MGTFLKAKFGSFQGGISGGKLSLGLTGGTWLDPFTAPLNVAGALSDGFAYVNSKLPASAAPIEAIVETTIVTAVKAVSVTF